MSDAEFSRKKALWKRFRLVYLELKAIAHEINGNTGRIRRGGRKRQMEPKTMEISSDLTQISMICKALVDDLNAPDAPKSRERSLVITKLEEAALWADAGARKEHFPQQSEPYYVTDQHGNKLRHG